MKKEILKLRQEGKSYREIQDILGCSKGTIAYHCGEGQKEKTKNRTQENRKKNPIARKTEEFKRKYKKRLNDRCIAFGKRDEVAKPFTTKDVENKFQGISSCYLTGRPIDLQDPSSFTFDHIIPRSRGGESSIENLGLCCPDANKSKSDMLVSELVTFCQEVLEHHGYLVSRISDD